MAVKFLQPAQVGTLYNIDEVAGFSRAVEADLIKRKIAEPYKPDAKAPA